jgi:hypothetical protein
MPLQLNDRIKEVSISTGTTPIILAGATVGFQNVASSISTSNTFPYVVELVGGSEWEIGIGQYISSNNSIIRTQIINSSNNRNIVNFSAGSKNVFVSVPAAYTALAVRGLSQFANTTGAELASIISDKTGTGNLVFSNNAVLVAPNIGVANGTSLILTGTLNSNLVSGNAIFSVANGSAPFTVVSNTVVSNLNSDLLDGQHGAYYTDLSSSAYALANAAYNTANTKFSANGGIISGSVTITTDLSVTGNVYLNGNVTTINSNNISINDSLIYLAQDNPANLQDIGIVGHFTTDHYQHTGLVRDATDGVWKLFSNVSAEPTSTVDFTGVTYDSFRAGNTTVTNLTADALGIVDSGNTAKDAHIEVGGGRTANGYAYVDLIGDTTYTDYGARFIRTPGANGHTEIHHRGTVGSLNLIADDAGAITVQTNSSERMRIDATGRVGIGSTAGSLGGDWGDFSFQKTVTGSVNSAAIGAITVFANDVTSTAQVFKSQPALANISHLTGLYHYTAYNFSIGSGSYLTNQVGFLASNSLSLANSNIGFYGDISANTGNYNLYMSGTADNYIAGRVGVGALPGTDSAFQVNRPITSGINEYMIRTYVTVPTNITGTHFSFDSSGYTANLSTISNYIHFSCSGLIKGANSYVSNQYGFSTNISGANNNFGFYGNVAPAANSYNLYMSSAADNYIAGKVGIGALPLNGNAKLRVAGDVQIGTGMSIMDNVYYDSGWKYSSNGAGTVLQLTNSGDNNSFILYKAANNTSGAGAAATIDAKFKISSTGTVTANAFVGDATGLTYTGASVRPSLLLDFANVKRLDKRITFIRSNTATYFDSTGLMKIAAVNEPRFDHDPATGKSLGLLMENEKTNLLTYSDGYDKFTVGSNTYLTSISALSPYGTYTATSMKGKGPAPNSFIAINGTPTLAAATTYTFSIYAKLISGSVPSDGNLISAVYNNGSTSVRANLPYATSGLTTSWKRFSVTFLNVNSISFFGFVGADSTSTSEVAFWGSQLEVGDYATSYIPSAETLTSRATTGTYYGSDGLIKTAAINTARYSNNSVNLTIPAKMLIEPASNNLLAYSEDFSQGWNTIAANSSITLNVAVAPDGTTTASKLQTTAAGLINTGFVNYTAGITANNSVNTFSVYVKRGSVPVVSVNLFNIAPYYVQGLITFNFDTGVVTTVDSVLYYTVTPIKNGWYRLSISIAGNSATSVACRVYAKDQGINNTTADYVYLWGAQLESNSYPTSYIKTNGSTVSRAQDIISSVAMKRTNDYAEMAGTNFSSWYRPDEGTLLGKARLVGYANTAIEVSTMGFIDDSSTTVSLISLRFLSDVNWSSIDSYGFNNQVSQWDLNGTADFDNINSSATSALAYKSNDIMLCVNGTYLEADTSAVIHPDFNRIIIGNTGSGGMRLAKLAYYPKRLSNAELQSITAG